MDIFSFAPIAATLDAAHAAIEALVALLNPLTGSASAAIAVVVLTLVVRTVLIPASISQIKAEWTRRRLAPKLEVIQRRYKSNPRLLQEKTLALYRDENASPFAGVLPTLAQAPVVSIVYGLFTRATIDGHANALLVQHLFGVPLGTSLLQLITVGSWPGIAVFAGLLAIMTVVAVLSRRVTLRLILGPVSGTVRALSWAPFLSVVFATFVPLAAALYLTTTTAWTLVERALLRRRYWRSRGTVAA